MNRLKEKYNQIVVPKMVAEFKYANVMDVPRIQKIVVNAGIGPFRDSREAVESFVADLTALVGQKPSPRSARQSIANFKIRENDVVGYTATLRGERMWAFFDKFINIALPRVRDFRGLSKDSFDDNGNYSVGIKEHAIFPEVNQNNTKGVRSLQFTVVFSKKNIDDNRFLIKELGVPFRKEEKGR